MDKTKKILSIILISLLIVSTVFTLCKKVGLCEEIDNSGYLFVPSITYYNSNFVQYYENIVDTIEPDFDTSGNYANLIYINSIEDSSLNSQGYTHVLMLSKFSTTMSNDFVGGPSASSWNGGYKVNPQLGGSQPTYDNYNSLGPSYLYYYSNGYWRSTTVQHLKFYLFNSSDGTVSSTTSSFHNKFVNWLCLYKDNDDNFDSYYMPIYCDAGIANSNNKIYGVSVVPSGGGGTGPEPHSKGGVLRNFIDSVDLLESDSSLPSVDTSAPSDSTSIPSWLQKILFGIGKVNQSIQGGVLTIGDYIGQFKQELLDKLNEIFSLDQDAVNDAWDDAWENSEPHTLVTHFQTMHSALLSIINVSPADTLVFNIDMYPITIPNLNGGSSSVYLFGRTITLDFSWYKSALFGGRSIQDIVLSVVLPFLYAGFIMSLFFKSPAIISGASGFASNVKEVSNKSSGWAPTSHGIFTTGVSRSSPSLDKSPLSGGGSSGVTSFWY